MTRSWARVGATLAASVLLGVACSGDGDDSPASGDGTGEATGEGSGEPGTEQAVFPGDEWAEADPAELGFDPAALDTVAEDARSQDSYCMVVTRHGRLAAEWYWQDTGPTTQHEAFSATKSYTATLVGIARDEGHLSLDDEVSDYVEAWQDTPSEEITIRDVLSNVSGRNWAGSDYIGMTTADDATAYAVGLGQDVAPGTTWLYNDGAIQTLEQVLEEATGTSPVDYARERIFEPIGAGDSHLSEDSEGNALMYFALQSTCRDMARFGHLYLRDGRWDGTQVLPEGWVEEATGQPSQDLNAAYGYLWWLNREGTQARPGGGESVGDEQDGGDSGAASGDAAGDEAGGEGDDGGAGQLVPGAPETMYWAQGLGGQIIQVHPETGTVVVRMGTGAFDATYGSPDTARVVTEALDP